jgi:CIC family chloride channel protein
MSEGEAPSAAPKRPRFALPQFGQFFWRDPNTQFLFLSAVAGALGALGAIVFRALTTRFTEWLLDARDVVAGAESLPVLLRIFLPAAGGLFGGLIVSCVYREAGGTHGISQMIEVVTLGRSRVRLRESLGRAAASIAVISSGGSEGREGPIIQVGAALASTVGRRWNVSPERLRILTACGMAAGVAGTYNTPIAATLFVLEVVVGTFSMTIFGPAVVSAVTSTLLVRFFLGDEPVYRVAAFRLESVAEFIPFALIGLLAGPASALFVRGLREGRRLFAAAKLPPPLSMALGGAIVGIIGIFLPEVWGNGFEGTNRILRGNPTLLFLLALFLGKIVATASTIGSGGVGGVFTPTLLVGATVGGVVAQICHISFPSFEAPVGGYALLGMGGLMAGVTRAPLLAVIMVFELTQNSQVLLPMMVVSVAAILSARFFEEDSIYIASLRSAGIVWEKTPEATAMSTLKVSDILRTDVKLLPGTTSFSQIVRTFLETRSLYLYIGDGAGRLLGVIDLHDVKSRFADPTLSDLVIAEDLVAEIPFATPLEPLTSVNEKLWFRDLGQLPVVDTPDSRKFLGIVTRRDLLGAFDQEVLQRSRLMARVKSFSDEHQSGDVDFFELPEKHRLAELPLPASLEGRTMGEAGLRSRFHLSVLAVRRRTREGIERRFVPGAEDRFERGDVLIVLGTGEAIAAFAEGAAPPAGVLS